MSRWTADFFQDLGADSLVMAQFCARVRKQPDLPAVSIKDIYQHPTIAALAAALAPAEPATSPVQGRLAEVLAGVLGIEQVPVDSDFFQDLGADSLVMAQFCARVRKQPDLPKVSMKEIYGNPKIAALAAALQVPPQQDQQAGALTSRGVGAGDAAAHGRADVGVRHLRRPAGARLPRLLHARRRCSRSWGTSGCSRTRGRATTTGWPTGRASGRSTCGRSPTPRRCSCCMCILPVAAKWIFVGRFRPREIRIWSLAYFRFWLVKALMRTSPLSLMAGSPLTTFYLRAMGAKVGRNVTIMTNRLPICTDLLTIGEGTVIRKDVVAQRLPRPRRRHPVGWGHAGPGRDHRRGQRPGHRHGDGRRLAAGPPVHSVHRPSRARVASGGTVRRAGARSVDYGTVDATPYRPWRRGWFAVSQLLGTVGLGRTMVGLVVTLFVLADPNRGGASGGARVRVHGLDRSTPTLSPTPA